MHKWLRQTFVAFRSCSPGPFLNFSLPAFHLLNSPRGVILSGNFSNARLLNVPDHLNLRSYRLFLLIRGYRQNRAHGKDRVSERFLGTFPRIPGFFQQFLRDWNMVGPIDQKPLYPTSCNNRDIHVRINTFVVIGSRLVKPACPKDLVDNSVILRRCVYRGCDCYTWLKRRLSLLCPIVPVKNFIFMKIIELSNFCLDCKKIDMINRL